MAEEYFKFFPEHARASNSGNGTTSPPHQIINMTSLPLSGPDFLASLVDMNHHQPSSVNSLQHPQSAQSNEQYVPSSVETSLQPVQDLNYVTNVADILLGGSTQPRTQPERQQQAGIFIPDSTPFDDGNGFKVKFEHSKSAQYFYDKDTNTIFINKNIKFSAQFSLKCELCPTSKETEYYVRTLVCLKNPKDIEVMGPVVAHVDPASIDKESDYDDHFLISSNPNAKYSEFYGHKIITVPISSMPVFPNGCPSCIYECVTHSSKFVGKGKNRPTMIIIFSLLKNGIEIARDTVNLRCLASLTRDTPKILKRTAEAANGAAATNKRRKTSNATTAAVEECVSNVMTTIPRCYDLVGNEQPDEDGYYTFTCKTKDRVFYNILKMFKRAHDVP